MYYQVYLLNLGFYLQDKFNTRAEAEAAGRAKGFKFAVEGPFEC